MLKIGEFSKLSRISIRMLRHYDETGLLRPTEIDRFTGYRYYCEDQLPVAGRIAALKDMGFGVAAIGGILKHYDDPDAVDDFLRVKQAELSELLEQTQYRLRLLETAREKLRKDDDAMKYNVTLKTLPERYAACVRMTIPSYDHEGMLWEVLVRETAPLKLAADNPCYCCVTFLDGEYRESDVDVEASKTVKGSYPDTEHVRFRTLPPVTFASAVCKGSYSQIGAVNEVIAQWVRENDYVYDGHPFNIYHVSPHETSNPDEFVTEICYPVRRG